MSKAIYWPIFTVNAIVWTLYSLLLIDHWRRPAIPKFQAVFLRVVFFFPVASTISATFSYAGWGEFSDVLTGILEGYLFSAFFALMVSWGWLHGDVFEALFTAPKFENYAIATRCFRCGPRCKDGQSVLWSLFWQVFQLTLIKPATMLIKSVLLVAYGHSVPLGPRIGMIVASIVALLSIILASQTLFRTYKSLRHMNAARCHSHTDDEIPSKDGLLRGLGVLRKFMIIKVLIFFTVLNVMVFQNLIPQVMPVPAFLCSDQSPYCIEIFIAFIYSCETLGLVIPALFLFRNSSKWFPVDLCTPEDVHGHVLIHFFRVWDVYTILLRPPARLMSSSTVDIESNRMIPDPYEDKPSIISVQGQI